MKAGDADLVVVGAGISGLTLAALAAAAGRRVLVLERAARVGGLVDTRRLVGHGDDFWFELGAHTCYRSYTGVAALLRQAGLAGAVLGRRRLPFRSWPAQGHGPTRLTAGLRVLPLLRRMPRWPWLRRKNRTVQDFFAAAVGQENHRHVVGPALDAVMCQDTSDVPAALVLRRRARARVTAALPRSFTLSGGLGGLPAALAALPGVTVRLGTAVHRVGAAPGGLQLETSDGQLNVPALALACDASSARPLLEGWRPGLGALLPELAPVISEAVVVPRAAVHLPPLAGLVGQTAPFFSMVTRDPVDDPARRAFTFHFRPACSPAERQQIMADVLGTPPSRWLFRIDKPAALPAFRLGHEERMRRLDEALAGSGLLLTGNYFTGAALEDCVSRSAVVFQRWLSLRGTPPAWTAMPTVNAAV